MFIWVRKKKQNTKPSVGKHKDEERFASSLLLRGTGTGTWSSGPSVPGAAVACHGFLRLGENARGFGGSL